MKKILCPDDKERLRKFLLGMILSFLTIVFTKVCTVLLESSTAREATTYLVENYSFWVSALAAAFTGGGLAQWKGDNK